MKEFYLFSRKYDKFPFIIKYTYNLIYLLDCSLNCILLGGDPTVSLSQKLGYVKKKKKKLFGKIKINKLLKFTDMIFKNHFENSYDKFGDRPWKWCESIKIFK